MIGGMTSPLPLPVRVAAGLVVTAVEQARDLPRLALELPVTAVSQALQASMRVQQKVTELAIKGDRVLGSGTPVEDEPAWATFDDDEPAPRAPRAAAAPVTASWTRETREPGAATTAMDQDAGPAVPVADTAGPAVLPGYAELTIPQLRGKLRHLGVDELRTLLAWEQAHGDRPPYVTMLSNRIATVSEG
jgi:hypothetical protein